MNIIIQFFKYTWSVWFIKKTNEPFLDLKLYFTIQFNIDNQNKGKEWLCEHLYNFLDKRMKKRFPECF